MKRRTIIIPTLLIGLGVGGLTVSQAFAQTNSTGNNVTSSSISNMPWSSNGFAGMMGAGFGPNGGSTGSGNATQNSWSGMMGHAFGGNGTSGNGWASAMGSMMSNFFSQVKTLKPADANRAMQVSLQNATMDKTNNSIWDWKGINPVTTTHSQELEDNTCDILTYATRDNSDYEKITVKLVQCVDLPIILGVIQN